MHDTISYAMEIALKQIAKRNLAELEYQEFVRSIRTSKRIRVGSDHKTVHEIIVEHAINIANWATHNRYQEVSDHVEQKKHQAIHNIKEKLGWH